MFCVVIYTVVYADVSDTVGILLLFKHIQNIFSFKVQNFQCDSY